MAIRTKKELLKHYSKAEMSEFIQFDAFADPKCFDGIVQPSPDGIAYMSLISSELMYPLFAVRVLITPGTKKRIVLKALKGIADWIERSHSDKSFKSQLIEEIKEDYLKTKVGFFTNKG